MEDEIPVRVRQDVLSPGNLEPLSVEELKGCIAAMEREIVRIREEIQRKESHLKAADALFKQGSL